MDNEYEVFGMDDFAEEIWNDIVEGEKRNAAQREQQEGGDTMQVDTYGEYGNKITGIRATQMIQLPMTNNWYAVDYSVESLSNMGDVEVLEIRKLVDEYGTGTHSLLPLGDTDLHNRVEAAFKKFHRALIGQTYYYDPHSTKR